MLRTLEPEVMDTAEEAADYDAMDHSTVNRGFVSDFLAALSGRMSEVAGQTSEHSTLDPRASTLDPFRVLDVGTGTALIPIELVRRWCDAGDLRSAGVARSGDRPQHAAFHITAIDLAEEMLKVGRRNVARAGYADRIALELVDAKRLPCADGAFDAVMSNSIVHHIPEPRATLTEMLRVLKPGGLLFVRDLLRPATNEEVERIVTTYAGDESPRQQQLFRQSLHAALTVDEVTALMTDLGGPADCVQQNSDRHWTITARR